jgi:hypothetical protein
MASTFWVFSLNTSSFKSYRYFFCVATFCILMVSWLGFLWITEVTMITIIYLMLVMTRINMRIIVRVRRRTRRMTHWHLPCSLKDTTFVSVSKNTSWKLYRRLIHSLGWHLRFLWQAQMLRETLCYLLSTHMFFFFVFVNAYITCGGSFDIALFCILEITNEDGFLPWNLLERRRWSTCWGKCVITNIGFQTEGGDFLMFNIGGWTSSAAHIYMVHMLCY